MSQSAILTGALLAAFVVWLAMNGRLSAYWAILTGSAAGAGGTSSTGTTPSVLNPTGTPPGTLLNPFAPGAGTGTITPLIK